MIESFIPKFREFVSSKPTDEVYDPTDSKTCALAQFVMSQGYSPISLRMYTKDDITKRWYYGGTRERAYALESSVCAVDSNTFGELATVLERTFGGTE